MSANEAAKSITGNFFLSPPSPCPYLGNRMEQKAFTLLSPANSLDQNSELTRYGFRRSQNLIYKQYCPNCSACVSIRLPVAKFAPSKSLRRITKRNTDLISEQRPAEATDEQFMLFQRYQNSRHADSEMAQMDQTEYAAMISEGYAEARLLELRNPDGILKGVILYDQLKDGASAVYSFFDPDDSPRSLGTYLVLCLIDQLRQESLGYLYLGYWIEGSRKMSYKSRFKPLEHLTPTGWKEFTS